MMGYYSYIDASALNGLPIRLMTHSSDLYIKELKHYGNMDEPTAKKVEYLWQDIMKKCLALSSNTEHIIAQNSGHYIHLTDFEVLKNTIDSLFIREINL